LQPRASLEVPPEGDVDIDTTILVPTSVAIVHDELHVWVALTA